MTAALARQRSLSGATVVNRAVHGVRLTGTALPAETDEGTLEADRVVIAAGSWSTQVEVEGDAPLPLRPIRGQLVRLDWPRPPLAQIVWSPRCYIVPRRDGTLLVGRHGRGRRLRRASDRCRRSRSPGGGVRGRPRCAAGRLQGSSASGCARRRRMACRSWASRRRSAAAVYATGHYRNGVLLAPVTAALVADLVLDDRLDPLLAAFSPGRFS